MSKFKNKSKALGQTKGRKILNFVLNATDDVIRAAASFVGLDDAYDELTRKGITGDELYAKLQPKLVKLGQKLAENSTEYSSLISKINGLSSYGAFSDKITKHKYDMTKKAEKLARDIQNDTNLYNDANQIGAFMIGKNRKDTEPFTKVISNIEERLGDK